MGQDEGIDMSFPRTMLFLGTHRTGASLSSNMYLSPICRHIKNEDLFRVCFCTSLRRAQSKSWVKSNGIVLTSPQSGLPVLNKLLFQLFEMRLGGILSQIEEQIERFKPDLLLFVLNLVQMIRIADRLRNRTVLPFFSLVWDAPERIMSLYPNLSTSFKAELMREFSNVVQHSKCVGVVSPGMGQHVRSLGASKTVVMYPAVSDLCDNAVLLKGQPSLDDVTIRIVFAGTLYAIQEWNAFLEAIDKWHTSGRCSIQLDYVGRFPGQGAQSRPWIRKYNVQPLDETIRIIKMAHIAYLPYHLAAEYQFDMQTSFPSKLSSYIAAGTPVLLHGPADSSAARFFEEYPVGRTCSSLEASEIMKALEFLLGDERFRKQYADARADALENAISERAMLRKFSEAVKAIFI
jgi:hypothetical protein